MNDNTLAYLNALAQDIEACELAIGITKGRTRSKFSAHRAACMAEINRIDPIDPTLAAMSDDDLLAALFD